MGDEGAHAELVGERQRVTVVTFSVLGTAGRRDVTDEVEGVGLAGPSPQPAAELQGLSGGDANRASGSGGTPVARPHSEQNLAVVESAAPQCPQDRARGAPHSSQNLACGRFSRWHRGQCIPSVSRFRITCCRPGSSVTAPGRSPQLGVSRPSPGGMAVPTLPRAGPRRQTELLPCHGHTDQPGYEPGQQEPQAHNDRCPDPADGLGRQDLRARPAVCPYLRGDPPSHQEDAQRDHHQAFLGIRAPG